MAAKRDNAGKPELERVLDFGSALDLLAAVMQQGAIKYDDGNWLLGGKPDSEYLGAALRHIRAFRNGEAYAPDTGNHHLAHAAWNLLAVLRLNYPDAPALDPSFDQAAFVARYRPDPDPVYSRGVEIGQLRVRPYGREYEVLGPFDDGAVPGWWEVRLLDPWGDYDGPVDLVLPEGGADGITNDPILGRAD